MNRRSFLAGAASLAIPSSQAATPAMIIDTHTHFYNPMRPGGTPWPPKDDKVLYRTVLPPEYLRMTKALGITGTIEVEASPLLEDNQWVLDLAAKHPIIVGTVGDIEAGKPGFGAALERFHKNPLFLGIRCGYLWGRDLGKDMANPQFIADLKSLAAAGLEMDSGGPNTLADLVRITDRIPNLRIVIDHLPYDPPYDQTAMKELGKRPQVYIKLSSVVRDAKGTYSRAAVDELWDTFGADRLIYGSNWPVSDKIAPFQVEFKVVSEYFAAKGQEATDKYFWKNSKAAYKWVRRS